VVDLSADIASSIRQVATLPPVRTLRSINGPSAPVAAWLRSPSHDIRDVTDANVVLVNGDLSHVVATGFSGSALPPSAGGPLALTDMASASRSMRPGEVRVLSCKRTRDIVPAAPSQLGPEWARATRIGIEAVDPVVSDGAYPAKTEVGRKLMIRADLIFDGHEMIAADLLWRPADRGTWDRLPMSLETNDRWAATIVPDRVGLYHFAIEAWWDQWGTYVHDLTAKQAAGQDVALEMEEGRALLRQASHAGCGALSRRLGSEPSFEDMVSAETKSDMRADGGRNFLARSAVYPLRADRPAAGFASWYELFPRSATADPLVHGTFRSVIDRLPAIQAMGFDVLYFPPIQPIGTINRKGRNNSLRAEPGDVGSPYAIGNASGGHDAIHPELGTFDDFQALIAAAHAHGLEIALDFAIQCAPDHPWVQAHRDWFRWRPDGSMRYAENPPKKYEDIVNPDFYGEASFPAVWLALRDVIQFWVDQGIRIFRVDNPHTKPLPFWQWMIEDIQSRNPDVLFLAEAFTRPKLMYRLAKAGFSQSYTYFTWRNTKQEITEYLTELSTPPVSRFFRPNFFVNTPDINPVYLQTSGRPGFLIRAMLAATLSGLWGVYSGFEICEAASLPGREEYLDSEKYEVRVRDYNAAGNIVREITTLNRLRRLYPALQTHLGVTFYPADNDQILLYGKGNLLMAVSLDPHAVQEANIELPLWRLGLPDDAALPIVDLARGNEFTLYGKYQRIRLDPNELPFHIWRLPADVA
jgi:starch synthase (maltosyl-transferring)